MTNEEKLLKIKERIDEECFEPVTLEELKADIFKTTLGEVCETLYEAICCISDIGYILSLEE